MNLHPFKAHFVLIQNKSCEVSSSSEDVYLAKLGLGTEGHVAAVFSSFGAALLLEASCYGHAGSCHWLQRSRNGLSK